MTTIVKEGPATVAPRVPHASGPAALAVARPASLPALLLLSADLAFLAVHWYAMTRQVAAPVFYVDADRSHAEIFQYLKLGWLILLTGLLALSERSWRTAAWLPLFGWFLLDDAFTLHERGGERAAELLPLPTFLGLRPVDIGELLVSAAAATVVFLPVLLALIGSSARERRTFGGFTVLVGVLVLFGVVVDSLHVVLVADPRVGDPLGWIEDGGEMLAVSALVVFALRSQLGGASQAGCSVARRTHRPIDPAR